VRERRECVARTASRKLNRRMQLRRLVVVLQFCGTLVISSWLAKSWWYNLSIYVVILGVIRLRRALYSSRPELEEATLGGLESTEEELLDHVKTPDEDPGNGRASPAVTAGDCDGQASNVPQTQEVVKTTVLLPKVDRHAATAKSRADAAKADDMARLRSAIASSDLSDQSPPRRPPLRQRNTAGQRNHCGSIIQGDNASAAVREEEMAEAENKAKQAETELLELLDAEGASRRGKVSAARKTQDKQPKKGAATLLTAASASLMATPPTARAVSSHASPPGDRAPENVTQMAAKEVFNISPPNKASLEFAAPKLNHLPSPARMRQQKQLAVEDPSGGPKAGPRAVPTPTANASPTQRGETLRRRRGANLPVTPFAKEASPDPKKLSSKKDDDLAAVLMAVAKSNALNTRRIASDTTTASASSSSPRDDRVGSLTILDSDDGIVADVDSSAGAPFSHGALEWLDEGVMCKKGEFDDAADSWLEESTTCCDDETKSCHAPHGHMFGERAVSAAAPLMKSSVLHSEKGGSLLAEISAMFPNATIHLGPPGSTSNAQATTGCNSTHASSAVPKNVARFVSPPRHVGGIDLQIATVDNLESTRAQAHDQWTTSGWLSGVSDHGSSRRPSQTGGAAEVLFAHSVVQRASLGPVPAQALTVAEVEAATQTATSLADLRQLTNASLGPVPIQAPMVAEVEASRWAAFRRAELRQQGETRLAEVEAARGKHQDDVLKLWGLDNPETPTWDGDSALLSISTHCSSEAVPEPPWTGPGYPQLDLGGICGPRSLELAEHLCLVAPMAVSLVGSSAESVQDMAFGFTDTWEQSATQPPNGATLMGCGLTEGWANYGVCAQGYDGPSMTTSYAINSHATMGIVPPMEHWDEASVDLMRRHESCMQGENLLTPYTLDSGNLEEGCALSDAHRRPNIVADSTHSATVEYQAAYQEMYQHFLAAKLEAAAPDLYED